MKRFRWISWRAASAWLPLVVGLVGCSASFSARTDEGPTEAKPASEPNGIQVAADKAGARAKATTDVADKTAADKTTANATGANATATAGDPMDWTNWRGPDQNGTSREVGLIDSWDPDSGKNVLWKRAEMGTRSTPIVMNGKLYALSTADLGTNREGERVYCLDAATGKTIWEQKFNVYLSDVPVERTAWSNVVGDPETGNVYALGVCGLFQCFDGQTGKVLWKRALHEEYGALSTYGGRTYTPIIFEDKVIISAIMIGWGDLARPAHRFLAFDKKTGEVIWFNGTRPLPYDTGYSTSIVKVLGGQLAMVFGSGDGSVWAMQPRTGRQIWQYSLSTTRGLNVTPLVDGDSVYMAHSEENRDDPTKMGSVVAINGGVKGPPGNDITRTGERWLLKEIMVNRSTPLIIDGRLYIFDDRAKLWVFDPKTGKQIGGTPGVRKENFALGTTMRASPLYADGKIYIAALDGRFYVLKPTPTGVTPVKQGRQNFLRLKEAKFAPGLSDTECHGSCIVSHGRVYLPTTECLYCLGAEGKEPKLGGKPPTEATETAVADDMTAAQVQLIPAESMLEPGKTQQFRVKLFNAHGQFLKDSTAEFSATGGGKITAEGVFTADAANKHQAAIITASAGKITGTARIRVIPPLPWKFEFSEGSVPITWVGIRFRHIAVNSDLLQALRLHDAKTGTHAANLYECISFYPGAKVMFDDALPTKSWSALVAYLGFEGAIGNVDDAKKLIEPSLEVLAKNKAIAKWTFAAKPKGVQLAVEVGKPSLPPAEALYKLDNIIVPGGITKIGTRSRGFMGPADLHDYTVEADLLATIKPGKAGGKPHQVGDIGVIAQGYTLAVMGSNKRLQIHIWDTQVDTRAAKWLDNFEIKPDTWYRLKLSVANEGDKAIARGKVWPRADAEPKEWMLQVEDISPNRSGAPGLFGNAREPGSPFYVDNVVVKANE